MKPTVDGGEPRANVCELSNALGNSGRVQKVVVVRKEFMCTIHGGRVSIAFLEYPPKPGCSVPVAMTEGPYNSLTDQAPVA